MFCKRSFLSVLVFIGNIYAAGGPPMLTDDPETPGSGNLELNLAYKGEKRSAITRYETPIIDINYGVGDNVQLKIETAYVTLVPNGESHTEGVGNGKIGVKWRFYENSTGDFLMSTYPQYTFVPIQKSHNNGIADMNQACFLPIEISQKIGALALTGEIGYFSIKGRRDEINYGAVAGYEIREHLELLAELYTNSDVKGQNTTRVANGGLKYWVSPNTSFLFSAGREVLTPEVSKATLFYVGLQLRY